MNKKLLYLLLLIGCFSYAQIPSYYNDVNLNLTGTSLKNELATKIINTQTTNLSYTPGVWNALKQTDLDPNNSNNVLLIYGYSDTDGNYVTDRTRSKNENGGSAGTQWNREHVYPKSLGTPNLGTSGPGADVHHLRPADISFNSQRSNKKFADGSGNAGNSGGGWYPGDEWKGDVARMMMYMYLRYGNQCLPTGVGIGTSPSSDSNMLNLFLEWNAEDPVSAFETQRNPIIEGLQGNRNPFIDNPAFATQIWGGPQAEDKFNSGGGGGTGSCASTISSFPYNQTLENTFGSWTQDTSDDFNWELRSGTTPSSNTGPSSASQGTYYAYMESSSPNYAAKRAILNSPCFDLSNASTATFTFQYHMYGASTMGSLTLEVTTNNGSTWSNVWSESGNQGSSWQTATVNLNTYAGQTISLRFNGVTGTTWQGDMAIDDLELTTTTSGGGSGSGSSLLFSEYVEGSSNNKALEIANLTGSTVDLSEYTIRKQTNGAGTWNSGLSLSGSLANNGTYVVAYSSASSAVTSNANITSNNSALTFNGNDPVGLFKNGVLVDIIGTFNGGSGNFAQNVTLRRKTSVTSPSSTYITSQWDVLATDTFDGLGNLGTGGGGSTPTNYDIRLVITFDQYPSETSWEIRDDNNAIVHSGGSYGSQSNGSSVTINETLAAGCYSLIFRDSYGDGICCSYGNGSYVLTNVASGATLASGGSFTTTDTKSFCVGTSARIVVENDKTQENVLQSFDAIRIYPNPVKGNTIQLSSLDSFDTIHYEIHNAYGRSIQKGILKNQQVQLQNLPEGIYVLRLYIGKEIVTKKFIKK